MVLSTLTEPKALISALAVHEGMHVADLGAGGGQFTFLLAEKVGISGKVFAVEVQKDLVDSIAIKAEKEGLSGVVVPVWGNIETLEGTKLRQASVDIVIVANTLFQIYDRPSHALEAFRILKNGGKLFVLDWTDSFGGMGPHASAIISPTDATKLYEGAGFHFIEKIPTTEHHYALVFKR